MVDTIISDDTQPSTASVFSYTDILGRKGVFIETDTDASFWTDQEITQLIDALNEHLEGK